MYLQPSINHIVAQVFPIINLRTMSPPRNCRALKLGSSGKLCPAKCSELSHGGDENVFAMTSGVANIENRRGSCVGYMGYE